MLKKLQLALIGAGQITEGYHLPAALASTQVYVAAIVDPATDRASSLACRFGIAPRIAADVAEIAGTIDCAVIATPNHTHKEVAIGCIDAGASVLIEKPLASTYAEGMAIVEAAARRSKVVGVGYCTRFRPSTVLLKRLLDQQFFGNVKQFYHQYGTSGGWAPVSGYILDRRRTGGGVLVVTGSHFLDRMLHFFGYPDEVRLTDDNCGGPEANAIGSFRYTNKSELLGKVRYSKTTQLPGGMVLETEAGIVTLADYDEADIVLRPKAHPYLREVIRNERLEPVQNVFLAQLNDFCQAVRDSNQPLVTGEQGLQSLRLIEDLYRNRVPLSDRWYSAGSEASWASA